MKKSKFDAEKAIVAMRYMAKRIEGAQFQRLLKVMYFAELKHLAKYGRQIVGDKYMATIDGPVPSLSCDLLMKMYDGEEFWKQHTSKSEFSINCFSKSEIECLDQSITENTNLSWVELRDKSYDSAWNEGWSRRSANAGAEMKLKNLVTASGASGLMVRYLENQEEYTITKSV